MSGDNSVGFSCKSVPHHCFTYIGYPQDPAVVSNKLKDQFQKKSLANKLDLRRNIYSLKLNGHGSVQLHITATAANHPRLLTLE